MKIDVYDTYAHCTGRTLHFDIVVESGTSNSSVLEFGRRWLESIGENIHSIHQSSCRFCHSRLADPEIERSIKHNGFSIFQMEGCPAPY